MHHTIEYEKEEIGKLINTEKPPEEPKEDYCNIRGGEIKNITNMTDYNTEDLQPYVQAVSDVENVIQKRWFDSVIKWAGSLLGESPKFKPQLTKLKLPKPPRPTKVKVIKSTKKPIRTTKKPKTIRTTRKRKTIRTSRKLKSIRTTRKPKTIRTIKTSKIIRTTMKKRKITNDSNVNINININMGHTIKSTENTKKERKTTNDDNYDDTESTSTDEETSNDNDYESKESTRRKGRKKNQGLGHRQ